MSVHLRPRTAALIAAIGVLALTATMDGIARSGQNEDLRAEAAARVGQLASAVNTVVGTEAAAVETYADLLELTGLGAEVLDDWYPRLAQAFLRENTPVRSLQLAPGGIIEYVYPLEGNRAAVGLDLLDDADRRRVLLPSIESGRTSLQGPFELVQGGTGLIVRHPIFDGDGKWWGFAAILLDWPAVAQAAGVDTPPPGWVIGVREAGRSEVIIGDAGAFDGEPVLHTRQVGSTETRWTFAFRPSGGWPTTADTTGMAWLAGAVVALLSAALAYSAVRRPELIEEQRLIAVAELEQSEARFQAVFQHAGVGLVVADDTGRVVTANPAFRQIVGAENADSTRTALVDHVCEEDRGRIEDAMLQVHRTGIPEMVEVRLETGGGMRWGRVRVTTLPGETTVFVWIVEDITDRLLAELALGQSEDRFRRLVEHAPIGIQREDHSRAKTEIDRLLASGVSDIAAWFDAEPDRLPTLLSKVMITDANPEARRLQDRLGTAAGTVPLVAHYTETTRAGFLTTLEAMAEGATNAAYSVLTRTADGQPLFLDINWQAPIIDGVPDYSNILVTLRDATILHETERRLREEVDSKDRFIASVAHELRTPLTAVVGFAHEVRDESGVYSEREKQEFVDLISFHSDQLAHLIEDLLVWARADIGEVQVRSREIDLGVCVSECIASLPGVDIPIVVPETGVLAVADPQRVGQILRNLATNAVRYGGPDSRIDVYRDGSAAVVDVSDDGRALTTDDMDRVFAPYARSEGSSSMPGSIGLGLTVSRTLSRLQAGDLTVHRAGDRTVFRLTLPLASESAVHSVA